MYYLPLGWEVILTGPSKTVNKILMRKITTIAVIMKIITVKNNYKKY